MKLNAKVDVEMLNIANENQNESEVNFEEPVREFEVDFNIDDLIAKEKTVVGVKTVDGIDRKIIEAIDADEFAIAEQLRVEAYYSRKGDGKSYGAFCFEHPIEEFLAEKPKRKRYTQAPYAKEPLSNILYNFAFKYSAYALRVMVRKSDGDQRVVKVYCDTLREVAFENHFDATKDCVSCVLTQLLMEIRETAKRKAILHLQKQNKYYEQYMFANAKIKSATTDGKIKCEVLFKHFAFEQYQVVLEEEVDIADKLIAKNSSKAVSVWITRNKNDVGGYDKNYHKDRNRTADYIDARVADGDWVQEREVIRVEESSEWLTRRKDLLELIAKAYPREIRVYEAVLDLLHDGILDFDFEDTLSQWQIKMIIASICDKETSVKTREPSTKLKADNERSYSNTVQNAFGVKVSRFVTWEKVGNTNKRAPKNNARIEYKTAMNEKVTVELNTVKNSIYAYCRILAKKK